ncbi:hypothetical protein [Flagellimonas abyssi]|uniref:Uncharacterized protein n=1 Tax=Flagellimonas abyssi TaxID=2864871 RepID=A0ABS7EVE2_9FLAO|nr:hypothetical protein [Allomuricauda abyssi]MBW8201598.1 hypothetical protein [Allomuricauda abyssi]
MEHLNIILPAILVAIGFLLKLFIGKNLDVPQTIEATCELPVDIILLALSFNVAYTIASLENQTLGLFYSYLGISMTILVVVLWRISINLYLKKNRFWLLILVLNLAISGFAIKTSVALVVHNEMSANSTENIDINKK